MFRWGILSTAKIAKEHVNPAIMKSQNGVLAAVASRDLSKAQAVANGYGAASFGSYEALLESDDIDGVYIPLTTDLHVEWAIKAANCGKHVLVEKPLALKADDINSVIEARNRNNVVISEAFMVTYNPQWHKVRTLLNEGAIGTLRQVDAAFTYYNKDPSNMRNQVSLGGGVIPDIGVYPTVTTRFATGVEPNRVHAHIKYDTEFGTDYYASVRADYGQFEQTFYISTQMALRQHMVFHGDEGAIELNAPYNANVYEGARVTLHDRNHKSLQVFEFINSDQYQLQAEEFVRATQGKGEAFSLENSFKNQKVLDAIYKSGQSDAWETV